MPLGSMLALGRAFGSQMNDAEEDVVGLVDVSFPSAPR